MTRPLILATNDDGLQAEGLVALAEAMADLGELWVVAPATPQSASSHKLTLHMPLRMTQAGERSYAVWGTPTDAVFLAVLHLLPRKPDLLVSGINHGPNLGFDTTYSGTVACALEGALMGIPSLAFSALEYRNPDFRDGVAFANGLARRVLREGLPDGRYLNVNFPAVPHGAVRGVQVTKLGRRYFEDGIIEKSDPRGRPYYWVGGAEGKFDPIEGSDCVAVHEGYISVTPLQVDQTDHNGLEAVEAWDLQPR